MVGSLLVTHLAQILFKPRVRSGNTLSIPDYRFAIREKTGNRKGHRDPVVSETVQTGAPEGVAANDAHSIIMFGNVCSHRPKVFHHGGYPITFLDTQFGRISNRHGPLREGSGGVGPSVAARPPGLQGTRQRGQSGVLVLY